MKTVEELAREIVQREGGFVDDRDDPGGATNWGVTIGTMKALGIDLNKDGRVDVADVKALQFQQAVDLFVNEYFYRPKLNVLPEELQPSVFDMQVNSGSSAVRILQQVLVAQGFDVAADGAMGPQTLKAITAWAEQVSPALCATHMARPVGTTTTTLLIEQQASRKYVRGRDGGKGGWITRAEEFMDPAFRLSDAEHRARCSQWQ